MEDWLPGDDEALLALHDLVPAAEEIDLTEEAIAELQWEQSLKLVLEIPFPDDDPPGLDVPVGDDPRTAAEGLALLQHVLGAVVIDEY